MYKMTLRSTAIEECRTVLLVKPLVKVNNVAFFKAKSRGQWEKKSSVYWDFVVNTKNKVSTQRSSGHAEISNGISERESYLATLNTFFISQYYLT